MKILVRFNNVVLETEIAGDVVNPEITLNITAPGFVGPRQFYFVGYADGAPYYQIKEEIH